MPIYGKRKYAPKRKTTTRRPRKYAARVYKKSTFAARVKKVIHSQIENKDYYDGNVNLALAYAGSVTAPTYIQLHPIIGQGAQSGQRVGNEINVIKGTIRGMINMLPYNAGNNTSDVPILVKMWICRRKSNNVGDGDLPATADWAQFFQTGNTNAGFASNTYDMLRRVNTDYWTVFASKTIQLSNFSAPDVTATLTPQSSQVSLPFSFNIAKHLGKLKYNDNTFAPSNKELFLVFQGVRCDGTVPLIGSFAEVHFVNEIVYEDA